MHFGHVCQRDRWKSATTISSGCFCQRKLCWHCLRRASLVMLRAEHSAITQATLVILAPHVPCNGSFPPPDIVTAWVRGHVSALYQSFISTNCIKCQQESHRAAVIGSWYFFLIERVIKLWWLSLKMCILINTYSHLSKQQIDLSPCRRHNAASH